MVENQDAILALPPAGLLNRNKIHIDSILISEHILNVSFDGKEMTSLAGKTYKMEGEKKMRLQSSDQQDQQKFPV